MSRRDLEPTAQWVERTGVPLLVAFTLGMITAGCAERRHVDDARAAVLQARVEVARITDDLAVWRDGCVPVARMVVQPAAVRP